MKNNDKERCKLAKMSDLWDWICVQVGFDKNGREIQNAIRDFCEMKRTTQEKQSGLKNKGRK